MVDPALDTLHAMLAAESEDVRLRAAKDVLDRAGYKPKDKLEHTGAGGGAIEFTLKLGDAHPNEMDVPAT